MKPSAVVAVAFLAGAVLASLPAYSQSDTSNQSATLSGNVVRYEPGKVIVVRDASGREVALALAPDVDIPAELEIQADRPVALSLARSPDGSWSVIRVAAAPENAALPTGGTTSDVTGTVSAYEAARSITIERPDGTEVTFLINADTQVPPGMAVGRTVLLHSASLSDSGQSVADTITYSKTKTKVKHGRTTTRTKSKTKPVGSD
jgi:hypothetical protein